MDNTEEICNVEKQYDIVILTDSRYIHPKERNWYINQVLLEDKILQDALEEEGLSVDKKDWADQKFDWKNTRHAIFRTTWDYFERFDEFFKWIENTKYKTNFIHNTDIIHWNIDKHYLQYLSKKNINIAPTLFIEKGKHQSLKNLFKKTGWSEAVIKPAISGAARYTYRISSLNYTEFEEIFQKLITQECMLFQEFLHNIISRGEISLIMIKGNYTHAIRKIAKEGDFRVQDDHGGITENYSANKEEIQFAKDCLLALPFDTLYARVDIVRDNHNKNSLSELELIEPELWFRNNIKAAKNLAKAIKDII
ncbi:MAG: hypothetical protein VX370_01340 [Bacteroidota bacterium]|nr:hypothetical protein [Bacteroidota bacterium]